MVAEVIADRQFNTTDALNITATVAAEETERSRSLKKRTGWRRYWNLALAGLLAIFGLSMLGLSELILSRNHQVRGVEAKSAPAEPAPAKTEAVIENAPESGNDRAPESGKPFKITVEVHQTLIDIAMQYLGAYNEDVLNQIRALNPGIVNPNHIEAGQTIWLPASPATYVTNNAPSANVRNLP
jgi:hypothetical protein